MKRKFGKWAALAMAVIMSVGIIGCGNSGNGTSETETNSGNDTNETETNTENDTNKVQTNSADAGDKISIVLATNWGTGDAKYEYFYPMFEKFQEEHKDTMDITLQSYSSDDYKTKIKTQTASGDLPDVFTYWGGGFMKNMVDANLLLNVDDYFADSENISREDFEDGAFQFYEAADGNAYGVPLESARGVLLVNSELFKKYALEYPTTYEELIAVSEVFEENDIIPMAIGSNSGMPSEFFFSELYGQYEGAAGELEALVFGGNFDTENAEKVAEVIVDMIDRGMFPEDTMANGGWTECMQLYTDGKAAMTYTYPWNFEFMSEEMQECSDIISIPKLPGATVDSTTITTGFTVYGFIINKQSFEDDAKHDAIVELCDFLASDELSQDLVKSGMVPCKKIDIDSDNIKLIMQKTIDFASDKELTQVHYVTIPSADAITMFDSSLDELFIKAITPKEFVDKVQAVLDKNNK